MEKLEIIRPGQLGFGYLIEQDGFIDPKDKRNKSFITEVSKIATNEVVIAEPLLVVAVLQKYDIENANGRIYPEPILRNQANAYQELINANGAVGENNHPESSVIDGERISHNITKIWWEGSTLMGELEILMSPGFIKMGIISCQGDHIANLLRKGIRIGVSSRGVGSLEEIDGKHIVQEDFEIICWDIVVSPSTPGSWIFTDRKQAQPFMEAKEEKKNLLIDDLDAFLN